VAATNGGQAADREARVSKVRDLQQPRGWAFATVVTMLKPPLLALTEREWIDGDKIPATGGCVVAVNHISHLDPLTLGLFLYDHGRLVRYLTKDALWRTPILKHIVDDAKQIPVTRMSDTAGSAFDAAVEAVRAGELIGVYPEGTITKDTDGWPMRGKTGAARIALATECPVIPIGQWGVQDLLPAYSLRLHPFPRKHTAYKAGDPVDLDDVRAKPLTNEVLHEATDRIMAAITALVEDLRGEKAPPVRFDPKASGVSEIGNPRRARPGSRDNPHPDKNRRAAP
jgi:1-acyl-sn-glycerol-3-phosphate acyltransferase